MSDEQGTHSTTAGGSSPATLIHEIELYLALWELVRDECPDESFPAPAHAEHTAPEWPQRSARWPIFLRAPRPGLDGEGR